jgi:hypothetical protein
MTWRLQRQGAYDAHQILLADLLEFSALCAVPALHRKVIPNAFDGDDLDLLIFL